MCFLLSIILIVTTNATISAIATTVTIASSESNMYIRNKQTCSNTYASPPFFCGYATHHTLLFLIFCYIIHNLLVKIKQQLFDNIIFYQNNNKKICINHINNNIIKTVLTFIYFLSNSSSQQIINIKRDYYERKIS